MTLSHLWPYFSWNESWNYLTQYISFLFCNMITDRMSLLQGVCMCGREARRTYTAYWEVFQIIFFYFFLGKTAKIYTWNYYGMGGWYALSNNNSLQKKIQNLSLFLGCHLIKTHNSYAPVKSLLHAMHDKSSFLQLQWKF